MNVHLIDGAYELFRHFFALPSASDVNGQEIGAVRGVLTSVLSIIEHGATHVGVATDHVVEFWGPKAAALTLSQYARLEDIPKDWREWHPSIRKARLLSESLFNGWNDALLFRTLATLRLDVPIFETVEDLRWKGPRQNFEEYCRRIKSSDLPGRVTSAKASLAKGRMRSLLEGMPVKVILSAGDET